MKKILLSAVIAMSVCAPAYAAAGNSSTATGAATAVVVSPIVLIHTPAASLNFGSFTTGTGGSVVVVASPTGSATGLVTGDVGPAPGSTNAADAFTVIGDTSRAFSIATTGGTITNGASSMAFTTLPSAVAGITTTSGTAAFYVGGTLTVGTGLATGTYNGSYSATVAYN